MAHDPSSGSRRPGHATRTTVAQRTQSLQDPGNRIILVAFQEEEDAEDSASNNEDETEVPDRSRKRRKAEKKS